MQQLPHGNSVTVIDVVSVCSRSELAKSLQGRGVRISRRPATVRVTNAERCHWPSGWEGRLVGRPRARIPGLFA